MFPPASIPWQDRVTVRFHNNLCRNDIRRLSAHILIVFCSDNVHRNPLFLSHEAGDAFPSPSRYLLQIFSASVLTLSANRRPFKGLRATAQTGIKKASANHFSFPVEDDMIHTSTPIRRFFTWFMRSLPAGVFLSDLILKRYMDKKICPQGTPSAARGRIVLEKYYNEGAALNFMVKTKASAHHPHRHSCCCRDFSYFLMRLSGHALGKRALRSCSAAVQTTYTTATQRGMSSTIFI